MHHIFSNARERLRITLAAQEIGDVGARGISFHIGKRGSRIGSRKPAGGCGLRRQAGSANEGIRNTFRPPAKIEHRRNQYQARDADSFAFLEPTRKPWRAKSAVAFTSDKFRAFEPFV